MLVAHKAAAQEAQDRGVGIQAFLGDHVAGAEAIGVDALENGQIAARCPIADDRVAAVNADAGREVQIFKPLTAGHDQPIGSFLQKIQNHIGRGDRAATRHRTDQKQIGPSATGQGVGSQIPRQQIITQVAQQLIIARTAPEGIGFLAAAQSIVALIAKDQIAATVASQLVIAR